jgi:hypothetical protein
MRRFRVRVGLELVKGRRFAPRQRVSSLRCGPRRGEDKPCDDE